MAAGIVRFASKAQRLRREQASELRQMVLALEGDAPQAVRDIVLAIDRNTAAERGWSFVMLGPAQNLAVVEWIALNAQRPKVSARLWARFFVHMRMDTGEICMTRAQMAEAVGAEPRTVSEALSELVAVGAIIRRQEGRDVRWFMNPTVGTCLTGAAREDAQRSAPPVLELVGAAGPARKRSPGRRARPAS